jgi:hypothetical protein
MRKWNFVPITSAANLRFLSFLAARSFRNLKFKCRTRIIKLLVPLCFRSSYWRLQQWMTNFGSGALALLWQIIHAAARCKSIFGNAGSAAAVVGR